MLLFILKIALTVPVAVALVYPFLGYSENSGVFHEVQTAGPVGAVAIALFFLVLVFLYCRDLHRSLWSGACGPLGGLRRSSVCLPFRRMSAYHRSLWLVFGLSCSASCFAHYIVRVKINRTNYCADVRHGLRLAP